MTIQINKWWKWLIIGIIACFTIVGIIWVSWWAAFMFAHIFWHC